MSMDPWLRSAESRWSEIAAERPDLAAAVALQRALVTRSLQLTRELERLELPTWSPAESLLDTKLGHGIPGLRGETIPLPVDLLTAALLDFCEALARGGAGEIASHVGQALRESRIHPGSLLVASLSRDQRAIRSTSLHLGLSPDLVWLVGEMAVGPVAFRLQQQLLTTPTSEVVENALASWRGTGCPACGSWPAMAVLRHGHRDLRCSFCGAAWRVTWAGCVYCRQHGGAFEIVTPDLQRGGRQLELCDSCGGYLKVVELSRWVPGPLLPIEDLATSDLDIAAAERGHGRPPLPEGGTATPCPGREP